VSACNPGQTFVTDVRGTSPFFAAWRSLVFASLGETGTQALYHWSFGDDQQYGEVDPSANPYLSYWVDYYLSHWLPSPPGQDILQDHRVGMLPLDLQLRQSAGARYAYAGRPQPGWFGRDPDVQSRRRQRHRQ
jgi:hypothetical protein